MALVTICGLGPGGSDLLTEETGQLLVGPDPVFVRTARHPSAVRAVGATSFDEAYENADSFDEVYNTITETVVRAAESDGHVVYAVPGSPLILERSVRHLRAAPEVDVTLLPAISFLDQAWARLGLDPVDDGVRLVDGLRFATAAADQRGPLLVAHVHAQWVLSDIKLALDVGPEQQVTVLQRLGTPDEQIFDVAWPDLDRLVEADHLTSLFLPEVNAPAGYQLARSVEMMRRLRQDCPWDRRQDHNSLRKYMVEEAYEVLDAIDGLASAEPDEQPEAFGDLEEELGDLWFQILFHAELAAEAGQFTIAEVAEGLCDKMIRRHPHVYAKAGNPAGNPPSDVDPANAGDLPGDEPSEIGQWERLKQEEKGRQSALEGIPTSLPALALAEKTLKRAEGSGVVAEFGPPVQRLSELLPESALPADVGQLLFAAVELARQHGVNAEEALRAQVGQAAQRFRSAERSGAPNHRWVTG